MGWVLISWCLALSVRSMGLTLRGFAGTRGVTDRLPGVDFHEIEKVVIDTASINESKVCAYPFTENQPDLGKRCSATCTHPMGCALSGKGCQTSDAHSRGAVPTLAVALPGDETTWSHLRPQK